MIASSILSILIYTTPSNIIVCKFQSANDRVFNSEIAYRDIALHGEYNWFQSANSRVFNSELLIGITMGSWTAFGFNPLITASSILRCHT